MTVMPGVVSLLDEALATGVALGVASSSDSKWVIPYLEKFELIEKFQTVWTCDQVPEAKPAPYLYLEACKSLGVNPANAVALEDSSHGVTAAKSAGMSCVAVPNAVTKSFDFGHADRVLNSLEETNLRGLAELVS